MIENVTEPIKSENLKQQTAEQIKQTQLERVPETVINISDQMIIENECSNKSESKFLGFVIPLDFYLFILSDLVLENTIQPNKFEIEISAIRLEPVKDVTYSEDDTSISDDKDLQNEIKSVSLNAIFPGSTPP